MGVSVELTEQVVTPEIATLLDYAIELHKQRTVIVHDIRTTHTDRWQEVRALTARIRVVDLDISRLAGTSEDFV